MATLKKLSRLAGVSISTVSKALNGSTDISEATRIRIIELANRHGYKIAKRKPASKLNEGPTIVVIYSDIRSSYFSRLLQLFDDHVKKIDGILIMSPAEFEPNRIIKLCRFYESTRIVDGIVFIAPYNVFVDISQFNIPIVGLAHPKNFETHPFDYICVDVKVGFDEGIYCLKQHGHKEIAFLSDKLTPHRLQFFKETMNKYGLPVNPSLVRVSEKRFEEAGFEAMQDILTKGNLPTAVFAAYDDVAIGAAKAIYAHGLAIPEDISLAGIDNTMCFLNGHNVLSSVNCHIEEQVEIASNLLLKKIQDPQCKAFQNIILRTSFIERNTISDAKKAVLDLSASQ